MTDYPSEIKSFYMKKNPDGKTMQGTDVLFPHIGEIIGGSVREEVTTSCSQRSITAV